MLAVPVALVRTEVPTSWSWLFKNVVVAEVASCVVRNEVLLRFMVTTGNCCEHPDSPVEVLKKQSWLENSETVLVSTFNETAVVAEKCTSLTGISPFPSRL